MSGIFGPRGVFPIVSETPPPAAYAALLGAFGDDADALDFYASDLSGWATGEEAQAVLDAAQVIGTPADAIRYFEDRPIVVALDFRPEFAPPFYDQNITVTAGAVLDGAIDLGTAY
jgi:hypothetical protein